MQRAHREIALYGLRSAKILVVPNRESVYTAAELGQGIMIGTDKRQMPSKDMILTFPIGVTETLECYWPESGENKAVEEFARSLREEFRKREDRNPGIDRE